MTQFKCKPFFTIHITYTDEDDLLHTEANRYSFQQVEISVCRSTCGHAYIIQQSGKYCQLDRNLRFCGFATLRSKWWRPAAGHQPDIFQSSIKSFEME